MSNFPNDKSTVFSIAPFEVSEFKPGIFPGFFKIPACLDDRNPERLVVSSCEHLVTVGGRKQPIRVTQPSFEIARSIVTDFLDGQLFSNAEAHPGVCWLQGEVATETFVNKHAALFKGMQEAQKKWFVLVVNKTQDDWNKYHNSRVVSDQARFAVRALGIDTPEWMSVETVGLQFTKCPACSTMNDPNNIVCTSCGALFTKELMAAKTQEEKMKVIQFAGRNK